MMREPVLPLLTNRVRRNYTGGALLSAWENAAAAENAITAEDVAVANSASAARENAAAAEMITPGGDDNRPEDWLASTTAAINAGMPLVSQEGIGRVATGGNDLKSTADSVCFLDALFATQGEYYLGRAHLERYGAQLGFLAKLLDSAMRLHTQVHPTREFARERLGSPWGKLECYVILGKREGCAADLRLGFQHPPTRQEWERIIRTQDIAAMDACFEPVPVEPGEVWLVPGGMVHALGEGLLLLEVMEPSDLVVRCEFEREGIVVPEPARFMGRDLEFCLDVFDMSQLTVAQVRERCRMRGQVLQEGDWGSQTLWVPLSLTGCFEVVGLRLRGTFLRQSQQRCCLLVVGRGRGLLHVQGRVFDLYPGARFLIAASAPQIRIEPQISGAGAEELELWCCMPG